MLNKSENRKIGVIIERYLLRVFVIVSVLAVLSVILFHAIYSRQYSFSLIDEYIRDVCEKTDEDFNTGLKEDTTKFGEMMEDELESVSDEWLVSMVELNSGIISEINVIDSNGIIINSSVPEYVGFDMSSGDQSAEFLCLLNGTDYYVQEFRGNSYDESIVMTYAGKSFSNGNGFLQLGVSEDKYHERMEKSFSEEVRHRRIGLIGYIVVLNENYECIGSTQDVFNGKTLKNTEILPEGEEYKESRAKINGAECYLVATKKSDYYIIGGFPVSESGKLGLVYSIITCVIILVLLICIFVSLSKNLRIRVVNCIENINASLGRIMEGDLNERVNETSSVEFESLSEGINSTVDRLNQMIEEANLRFDEELEMARVIQSTSIPIVFPPFPQRKDIGLFAMMDTAKKVGGDFYDYYMLSGNRLAIVIADVSDKGIPAALFMMKAKTVIKSLAVSGIEVDEVMIRTNDELIKANEAEMFVTVWIGFLELDTGLIKYVHAGHTCPMLIRDGSVSMIQQKRNFIVGGRPGIKYLKQEIQLKPGDTVFMYTDGVTEAFDINKEEYGNERLEAALLETVQDNTPADPNEYCEKVCKSVRESVAVFSADVPQSDDITMLCLKYVGSDGI